MKMSFREPARDRAPPAWPSLVPVNEDQFGRLDDPGGDRPEGAGGLQGGSQRHDTGGPTMRVAIYARKSTDVEDCRCELKRA